MAVWFTSDHHFGHKKIIEYCERPFHDVEEMDVTLIENWNKKVNDGDTVYYVGDFTLGGKSAFNWYRERLRGDIVFIEGSHDAWARGMNLPKLLTVEIGKNVIVLCHYAMRSWDRSHYGTWHLFGHHHSRLSSYGLSFDVGVDGRNFSPWSFEEVAEMMSELTPIVDYSKQHSR